MIIYIVSQLFKKGVKFDRKPDGILEVSNLSKDDVITLRALDEFGNDVAEYLKSVDDMNNIDKTIWKMMMVFCGWQQNQKIKQFINDDENALNLFLEYQAKLNANGWNDIYSDYREFETQETELIKAEIFKRATSFSKASK